MHFFSHPNCSMSAKEMQEGISYGANDTRDGVNLSMLTKDKLAISPTELFSLDNLEAFIKLAWNFPIAKVRFKYMKNETE